MGVIQVSSPILKTFVHADVTVGTAISTILTTNTTTSKRVIILIQNKSATATIEVRFSESASVGILVPPLSNISVDNYNGIVRCSSSAASTLVHVAYSEV